MSNLIIIKLIFYQFHMVYLMDDIKIYHMPVKKIRDLNLESKMISVDINFSSNGISS